MKQTQMYICTLEEFILVEIWIHCCTSWNWVTEGKNYTGIYIITTMDENVRIAFNT